MSRGKALCFGAGCLTAVVGSSTLASKFGATNVRSESVRFLVGEGNQFHYDSYVLPLSDPAAIAHARDLIQRGPAAAGEPIVVARVAHGRDGINRDYIAPGAPLWSWHVAEFVQFTDSTAEILDGYPGGLGNYEDDPEYDCCGMIGFWNYTVVAELPSGDYDGDLDVDHDDYLAWRGSFGATIKTLGADGSGDRIVDAADYVVGRKNLGSSTMLPPYLFPPAPGSSIAVPEPGTLSGSLWATVIMMISVNRCITIRRLHVFS